jgi:hypothetical protein
MNNARPLKKLPPLSADAQDLYERQLDACGAETMLATGHEVDGQFMIRVCPKCHSMASELGGSRRGCGLHSIQEYDFIRVLVKTVDEPDPEVEVGEVGAVGPRARPSQLAEPARLAS